MANRQLSPNAPQGQALLGEISSLFEGGKPNKNASRRPAREGDMGRGSRLGSRLRGLPLWKSDKAKSEAHRLFVKGSITKNEARRRITDADAQFRLFMSDLKSMDASMSPMRLSDTKGDTSP